MTVPSISSIDRSESEIDDVAGTGTELMHYYALRITLPHSESSNLVSCIYKHCKRFIAGLHIPHPNGDESERNEHFHFILLGLTQYKVDAMRNALRRLYPTRSGNAFMAGKWMDNFVYKGIQYLKHDPSVEFLHRGSGWEQIISDSPDWEERRSETKAVVVKEKLSFPTLTHSNVVKQALKWRREHNIQSDDLAVVCEHMTRCGNWEPHISIMRQGLDRLHYDLFRFKCHRTGEFSSVPTPAWWRIGSI